MNTEDFTPTLMAELIRQGAIKCQACGATMAPTGEGEDEYGPHTVFTCGVCNPTMDVETA